MGRGGAIGAGLADLGAAPSGALVSSPSLVTLAVLGGAIFRPASSGASPRALRAGIREWLRRQRRIMIKAASMISAPHSATSASSTSRIGQPPGTRSHLALYPLSPCHYRADRWYQG